MNIHAFVHFLQSGKSTVLDGLFLAVVAKHPFFGIGGQGEVAVLKLDLAELPVKQVRFPPSIHPWFFCFDWHWFSILI